MEQHSRYCGRRPSPTWVLPAVKPWWHFTHVLLVLLAIVISFIITPPAHTHFIKTGKVYIYICLFKGTEGNNRCMKLTRFPHQHMGGDEIKNERDIPQYGEWWVDVVHVNSSISRH